jgi:hypothetical protein
MKNTISFNGKEYLEVTIPRARLNDVVEELLKYQANGELVCTVFSGHRLYSDTVTLDSAYLEVTGETAADFFKRLRAENFEAAMKRYSDNLRDWEEKSIPIIAPKYRDKWFSYLSWYVANKEYGLIKATLKIIKILNDNQDFEAAIKTIHEAEKAGTSMSSVASLVTIFCDRGDEFIQYLVEHSN